MQQSVKVTGFNRGRSCCRSNENWSIWKWWKDSTSETSFPLMLGCKNGIERFFSNFPKQHIVPPRVKNHVRRDRDILVSLPFFPHAGSYFLKYGSILVFFNFISCAVYCPQQEQDVRALTFSLCRCRCRCREGTCSQSQIQIDNTIYSSGRCTTP